MITIQFNKKINNLLSFSLLCLVLYLDCIRQTYGMENSKNKILRYYMDTDNLEKSEMRIYNAYTNKSETEQDIDDDTELIRHKPASFSKLRSSFSKTKKTLKRRLSHSKRKKVRTKDSTETDSPDSPSYDNTENIVVSAKNVSSEIISSNNEEDSDYIANSYQDIEEFSLKDEEFYKQDDANIIDSEDEYFKDKKYQLVRKDDDILYLEKTHDYEDHDYEFMGGCLNKFHIYKINEFMIRLASYVTYQGYYTPKNMSVALPKKIKKSEASNLESNDLYVSMESIFHQVEVYKMIDIIGKMKSKNITIEKHKHYVKGIHLSFNILSKVQFSITNENENEKLSHCINTDIEDKSVDEISDILKNICHQEQSANYKNYLSFIINFQANYIKKIKRNVLFFTDEHIYSLLSTNIKIYNDYYNALKKMKFSLYAFDSYTTKNHEINGLNFYYYADYYIIVIDFLIKDRRTTKFYKVKGSHTMSESFDLFNTDYINELMQDNLTNGTNKFLVLISLVFPFYTSFGRQLEISDTQFELSMELKDNANTDTPVNEDNTAQKINEVQSDIDKSPRHDQKKEFSFLLDDEYSIVEINDLSTEVEDVDILEVTTSTLLIFDILNDGI